MLLFQVLEEQVRYPLLVSMPQRRSAYDAQSAYISRRSTLDATFQRDLLVFRSTEQDPAPIGALESRASCKMEL